MESSPAAGAVEKLPSMITLEAVPVMAVLYLEDRVNTKIIPNVFNIMNFI